MKYIAKRKASALKNPEMMTDHFFIESGAAVF